MAGGRERMREDGRTTRPPARGGGCRSASANPPTPSPCPRDRKGPCAAHHSYLDRAHQTARAMRPPSPAVGGRIRCSRFRSRLRSPPARCPARATGATRQDVRKHQRTRATTRRPSPLQHALPQRPRGSHLTVEARPDTSRRADLVRRLAKVEEEGRLQLGGRLAPNSRGRLGLRPLGRAACRPGRQLLR